MKITALTENTAVNGMPAEHGLSLYIETERCRILFDTGQSDLFARNAEALGIDLSLVDVAVLSHGHYDHGGGLSAFLRLNAHAPVMLHRCAFEPHFRADGTYIGLDRELLKSDRLVFCEGKTVIGEGLTLFDQNTAEKETDLGSFGLCMEQDGAVSPDDFRHEHYLLIEENGKRVLISGCSHKGILNIAHWFCPDALVGGFHFSKLPLDDTLTSYARRLASYPTDYYTCHCTGVPQYEWMRKNMDRLRYLSTGQTIII